MVTRLYSHPVYLEHITPPGHPERPDRLRAIERVLEDEKFAALDRVQAPEGDAATILYAHPQSFVDRVQASIPETGIQRVDADTTVSPKSWQATLTAIGAANAAVDDVFAGRANNVFVASRPPGHHAEKTTAMGFCLFNHAAIAALMQVYFMKIEGQVPDPAWDMRLAETSKHFRELKDRALASVGGTRWGAAPGAWDGAS